MVVALDLSEYSNVVLEHALDLAARHDACEIQVIVVHEDGQDLVDEKRRLGTLLRDELPNFHAKDHDWKIRMHVRVGDPADEIAALAGEALADVIVIGRFGRHRTSWLHGSVTDRVLARAPCSTLVVQLTDIAVADERQCVTCVEVRHESDGERWFCEAHRAPDRAVRTFLPGVDFSDGGLMW